MKKNFNKLSAEEKAVILDKATEKPFTGEYTEHSQPGLYLCKQCDAPLYLSEHKFSSACGWPSFDDEVKDAVKRVPDADGRRVEILCARCDGHLGHVFEGEQLTEKNIRHCVNSISMKFIDATNYEQVTNLKKAYFAGGCFWGVEHLMQQLPGVLTVVSGFMGGHVDNPSYEQVCNKNTGHVETVEVLYDAERTDFETLAKFFFEIHDPTQGDGQGPDKGPQYASVIFYKTDEEKNISQQLIKALEKTGLTVITKVEPADTFWPADAHHQNYYEKKQGEPYCHRYQKRFKDK